MTFAYPNALFLLLLLIPFAVLAIHNYRKKRRILREFVSAEAEERVVVRGGREIDFFKTALLLAVFALAITALARPQWGERFESVNIRGLEIVFLLDTSASMNAQDLPPSRLEAAKNLVSAVVDVLRTDRVSLVNFAAAAYVQCPPTLDHEAFKLLAQSSSLSPEEEQGTDFAKAFALGSRLLGGSRSSQQVMILISDGEDQEGNWPEAVRELRKRQVTVFTVGVGAPGGAPIPILDGTGRTVGWKKDRQGNMVRSRLDEDTLARIAAECSGQYYRLGAVAGIPPLLGILRTYERQQLARRVQRRKIDRFAYPLLLAVLLLATEMALSDRRIAWRKG
ncbi:MAG: VWA domain-containing protein [Candidatus Aminicenantes bacterium]|nr:VWA domain-containing protein [Candidatus Aminicenantes bacterium]